MATGSSVVAKKKKPKPEGASPTRFGSLVRLADDVVRDAKVVASLSDVSMAEFLSDLLRPLLKQSLRDALAERLEGDEPPPLSDLLKGPVAPRMGTPRAGEPGGPKPKGEGPKPGKR